MSFVESTYYVHPIFYVEYYTRDNRQADIWCLSDIWCRLLHQRKSSSQCIMYVRYSMSIVIQRIDERIQGCWFLTYQDLWHWRRVILRNQKKWAKDRTQAHLCICQYYFLAPVLRSWERLHIRLYSKTKTQTTLLQPVKIVDGFVNASGISLLQRDRQPLV